MSAAENPVFYKTYDHKEIISWLEACALYRMDPPSDKTLRKVVSETLAWVNEHRAERGLGSLSDLRPGVRRKTTECAITNSLEMSVGNLAFVPRLVASFISWFDIGLFPQYDVMLGVGRKEPETT